MLRIGIIGLGAVTRNIHLAAYDQLSDRICVVAGCDVDSRARQIAVSEWGIPAVFDSPAEMIEKTRPDVVSVCTPPALHHEHALIALEHGCHVFCEKPLAETLAQADEMIGASEKARRHLVVNNQFPYMNIHLAAKRMIGSPEFGRLLFLHAWQIFHPTAVTEAGWRGNLKKRLCFEFGTHVFELIRFFFEDTPIKLMSHMPDPSGSAKCDIINIVSLEFADRRAACVLLNRLSHGPERYLDMRLDGDFASIHTSIGGRVEFKAGLHTKIRRPFVTFDFSGGGKAALQKGDLSRVLARDGMDPFASATARQLGEFISALDLGRIPPGGAADNRNTLGLVLAAYEAAERGVTIDMRRYLHPDINRNEGLGRSFGVS